MCNLMTIKMKTNILWSHKYRRKENITHSKQKWSFDVFWSLKTWQNWKVEIKCDTPTRRPGCTSQPKQANNLLLSGQDMLHVAIYLFILTSPSVLDGKRHSEVDWKKKKSTIPALLINPDKSLRPSLLARRVRGHHAVWRGSMKLHLEMTF